MKRFLTTGFFGAILGIVIGGAPADASLISRSFLDQALTDYATNTALDLKADNADLTNLSNKIGELPTTLSALPPFIEIFGMDENIDLPTDIGGILSLLFSTDGGKPTFYGLASAIMRGFISSDGTSVPGLRDINDKIGTLPSGSLIGNGPAMDELFMYTQNTDTPVFPNSLSDLIHQLYVANGRPGAISALLHGFDSGGYDGPVGILPAMDLGLSATRAAETAQETATAAKTAADANTAKIGTLPDGLTVANLYNDWTDSDGYRVLGLRIIEDKNFTAYNPRTGQLNETTDPHMGGLLGMLDQLFSSNGYEIADEVIAPFWYLTKQAMKVGEIPHEKTVAGMISETDAKIGTLPDGYDSVGAALTAIKSDIDAKSLPSTSADGQYVLSAKKVGDTITYTWVRMDLTSEEQAQ